MVHAADIQDRDGARRVIERIKDQFPRLRRVCADGGYAGELGKWVSRSFRWVLEIVKRCDDMVGFQVLPHRGGGGAGIYLKGNLGQSMAIRMGLPRSSALRHFG